MEGRGKSRRRNPYWSWKRRGSGLLAVLLTLSLVFGDISGLSRVVLAGQGTVREEFRIHQEEILKAAEEAIQKGEPLSEPLAVTSEKEKTEEKYQKILPADGTVYEIFPEIEQVKDVDSLELRVFIRLAEGADPASYTLTGDETLVFLYVNGGETAAEGRVNIDGYVSEFTKVEALDAEEAMESAGNGAGTGAASGNTAGTGTGEGAEDSSTSASIAPEDSASDLIQETETGTGAEDEANEPENQTKPEDTLPVETAGNAETEESAGSTENAGTAEVTEDEETVEAAKETEAAETAGSQEKESNASDQTENADDGVEKETGSAPETEAEEDKETAAGGNVGGAVTEADDAEEKADKADQIDEADKADKAETAGNAAAAGDASAEDDTPAGTAKESTVTLSMRQIQRVAAPLASASETEKENAGNPADDTQDEDDAYYENTGDPIDKEDAAAGDEEDLFKEKEKLKGKKYDEAVLDEDLAVRAFAVTMEDAGFARETLLEGAHHLTYTVSEGEARLVYAPEYVRDEAVVTFGVIPKEGMEVYQVTANGEALAETEATAAIASASEAKRASSSDADADEERTVYYQIPRILEDQDVKIQVVEEGYNSHPAFLQSRTVNGVTVTVSAEEGILPAGTELSVEEVTEQVADAVAEKVEAEAAEEEPVSVTSVLAYDITLWDAEGNLLDNSWNESGKVKVEFSGKEIEEKSEAADRIEIAHLEMESDVQREEITRLDVNTLEQVADTVEVVGSESVSVLEFEAEHFSTYTIIFSGSSDRMSITVKDLQGNEIGKDDTYRLNGNDPVSVEEIAEQILLSNRELQEQGYTFAKAEASKRWDVWEFTQVRYYKGWIGSKVQVKIDRSWKDASGYDLTMYFVKSVEGKITVSGNGSVTLTADGIVKGTASERNPLDTRLPENSSYTLKFTPQTGYTVNTLTINGKQIPLSEIGNNNEYVVSGITEAQDIQVSFAEIKPVKGSVTVFGNGSVEVKVKGVSQGTAVEEEPLTGINLPGYGPYTLKFTPGEDYAVGAITINGTSIALSEIGENKECEISGIAGDQDIKVYFSELISPDLNWSRSDSKDDNKELEWYERPSYSDSDIYVLDRKSLNFDWNILNELVPSENVVWDKGTYFGDYAGKFEDRSFASWRQVGENDKNYELRRFQTTFTIPEGYSASDYIRLKTVGTEEYLDFNDGNIIPINDDIFIFVYKEDENINNSNYLDHLAFWSGTSNQHGITTYHGIQGTTAIHGDKNSTPFPYTDGWYCEADLDNIGSNLFKNYPDAEAGETFILDVFSGEYADGGGMDELIVEFVKSSGFSATIRYYKDRVTTPDDSEHYLGAEGLKGLALGESINLETYENGKYLNLKKPEGSYEDGVQLDVPYIVTEENGVINVLYTTQTKNVNVEYYTRDTEASVQEEWKKVGTLENQKLPLGVAYADAVNTEYGKTDKANPGISSEMRDWYSDGYVVDGDKTIDKDTTVIQVVYTRKYGSLPIWKELQGYTGKKPESGAVKFQLYQANENWELGETCGDPSAVTWEANNTGTAVIDRLNGGYYILKEIKSADGYNLLAADIRIQITLDEETEEVIWKVFDESGKELAENETTANGMVSIEKPEEGKGLFLKVINTPGTELPETGGPGIIMMERFGWMLLLIALAGAEMQIFSRRRRKEKE